MRTYTDKLYRIERTHFTRLSLEFLNNVNFCTLHRDAFRESNAYTCYFTYLIRSREIGMRERLTLAIEKPAMNITFSDKTSVTVLI